MYEIIGRPTPFLKLNNLSKHLGGAQIYAKHEAMANSQSHKSTMLCYTV